MFINSHWVTQSVNHSTYFTASFLSVSGDFILRDNHLTSLDKHKQPSTPAGRQTERQTESEREKDGRSRWDECSDLIMCRRSIITCEPMEGCMLGRAISRITWSVFSSKRGHSVALRGENSQSEAGRVNPVFRRYKNTLTFTITANGRSDLNDLRSASALALLDLYHLR